VGSEQWVAETGIALPPTRVFWEKRLQAVENKGQESQKEGEEAARD
jgi:hypothetical protein